MFYYIYIYYNKLVVVRFATITYSHRLKETFIRGICNFAMLTKMKCWAKVLTIVGHVVDSSN